MKSTWDFRLFTCEITLVLTEELRLALRSFVEVSGVQGPFLLP